MITTILWITLIASIILLIAVASPIRLSCKVAYGKNGRDADFYAVAHYPHPRILRAEYSAANGLKFFILGFEKGDGDRNANNDDTRNNDIDNTDDINGTDGINAENTDTEDVNAKDINNTDVINAKNTDTEDVNTNDINNTKSINTETENVNHEKSRDTKEKRRSISSKIRSGINGVKRHNLYKILRNKPLRKKLSRWIKRSLVRAVRIVSVETLKLRMRIGLRDPATLGKIYGWFLATQSALSLRDYRIDLSVDPVFTEDCLHIDSELKIKTTPSIILWQLAIIAVTFPYWKVRKEL